MLFQLSIALKVRDISFFFTKLVTNLESFINTQT